MKERRNAKKNERDLEIWKVWIGEEERGRDIYRENGKKELE